MNQCSRISLILFTLGIVMFFFGCDKSGSTDKNGAAATTDVVLVVPGMY
jgi:hypothetical protein